MAKLDVLDILRMKKVSPLEFDFDNLLIPPIQCYLTMQDIDELRKIATSLRLSSKIDEKYKMIDNIMRNRGFKRFSAGTNRVVYSFLEDDRFLVKIAVDKVGMKDNPLEYENQFLLKPYVTKMFYISQCGTVGFCERVLPVKNKSEFKEIADDVFEILVNKILGKYVVEDVGTKFFMNWGIRPGYGPVLLDYPYIYKLDGAKLYCSKKDPITNIPCNGEIDYDVGFNYLVCTKCGKRYLATDLRDDSINNKIIIKGGNHMKIAIKKGETYFVKPTEIETREVMSPPKNSKKKASELVVSVFNPKTETTVSTEEAMPNAKNVINDRAKMKYNLGISVKKENEPTVKEAVEEAKKEEKAVEDYIEKSTTIDIDGVNKSDVTVEEEPAKEVAETDNETSTTEVFESETDTKEGAEDAVEDDHEEEAASDNIRTNPSSKFYNNYEDDYDSKYDGRNLKRDSKGRFVKKKYRDEDRDDRDISRKSKKDRISTKSKFID